MTEHEIEQPACQQPSTFNCTMSYRDGLETLLCHNCGALMSKNKTESCRQCGADFDSKGNTEVPLKEPANSKR